MSKIFVDFEMTGLTMKDKPISIGIVAENGNSFYAEFNDYDVDSCSDWVRENVIENLKYNDNETMFGHIDDNIYMKGSTDYIADHLQLWLEENCELPVEFIGDCCHYDFCHFLELFGGALGENTSKFVYPTMYDINPLIAIMDGGLNDYEAFNVNREEFLLRRFNVAIDNIRKHNSLYDALIIKLIYDKSTENLRLDTEDLPAFEDLLENE